MQQVVCEVALCARQAAAQIGWGGFVDSNITISTSWFGIGWLQSKENKCIVLCGWLSFVGY